MQSRNYNTTGFFSAEAACSRLFLLLNILKQEIRANAREMHESL